jgi:allantoinase
MKTGAMMKVWGGIAGVQSTLAVLLERGHFDRGLPLERIAALTAATPARRFRIARKGELAPGNDADLMLVDLSGSHTLSTGDLHQRHALSPYVGSTFRGVVRRTLLRGEIIFKDGAITAQSGGALVRPS